MRWTSGVLARDQLGGAPQRDRQGHQPAKLGPHPPPGEAARLASVFWPSPMFPVRTVVRALPARRPRPRRYQAGCRQSHAQRSAGVRIRALDAVFGDELLFAVAGRPPIEASSYVRSTTNPLVADRFTGSPLTGGDSSSLCFQLEIPVLRYSFARDQREGRGMHAGGIPPGRTPSPDVDPAPADGGCFTTPGRRRSWFGRGDLALGPVVPPFTRHLDHVERRRLLGVLLMLVPCSLFHVILVFRRGREPGSSLASPRLLIVKSASC